MVASWVPIASLCPGYGHLPGYSLASRSLARQTTSRCLSTALPLNPEHLASLEQTGAVPLPVLGSGSDYRGGFGELMEVPEAGAVPSAAQAPNSFSTAAPGTDGPDSTPRGHKACCSDSGDGACVPLLQTESTQLGDLDPALLAEVKDVLISHERVVTHSDQVIGKGMRGGGRGWGTGGIGTDGTRLRGPLGSTLLWPSPRPMTWAYRVTPASSVCSSVT